jgi:hypothetical protein
MGIPSRLLGGLYLPALSALLTDCVVADNHAIAKMYFKQIGDWNTSDTLFFSVCRI